VLVVLYDGEWVECSDFWANEALVGKLVCSITFTLEMALFGGQITCFLQTRSGIITTVDAGGTAEKTGIFRDETGFLAD